MTSSGWMQTVPLHSIVSKNSKIDRKSTSRLFNDDETTLVDLVRRSVTFTSTNQATPSRKQETGDESNELRRK